MNNGKRLKSEAIEHIRHLFENIKDGKITIARYDPYDSSYTQTYSVSCTVEDADKFIFEYEALVKSIEAIAEARKKLNDGEQMEDVLTPEQIAVWNTYIREFDDVFDVSVEELNVIYNMRDCGAELNDEEQEIIERHHEWFEAQCLKRLPRKKCSPMLLINRAQRYEYLVSCNAHQTVLDEEGRCLAEEMLLYYFGKE